MIAGTQYTSEKTLNTDSDLDWRRSRKTLLTENGAESGKMHNMRVIENFETFPYKYALRQLTVQELWSLQVRGAAENQLWTD
jgi:hypothetical protein